MGYAIGTSLKRKNKKWTWTSKVQTLMIIILIFLMGSRLTVNDEIVQSLGSIGVTAIILTVFIFAGSIVFVTLARKLMGINRQGVRTRD